MSKLSGGAGNFARNRRRCYRSSMQKRWFLGLLFSWAATFCASVFLSTAAVGVAQSPDLPALPKDPKSLLELAAATNGLRSEAAKPWHLQASITSFDERGAETDHANFEEFWVAPARYKIVYTASAFSQTVTSTEKGLFVSGAAGNPPEFLVFGSNEFLAPIPASFGIADPANDKVESVKRNAGPIKLQCLAVKFQKTSFGDILGPTYCLDVAVPALRTRIYLGGTFQSVYNNIVALDGHYVARQIEVLQNGKKVLAAQVTKLETLNPGEPVDLSVPPGSAAAPEQVEISSRAAQSLIIKAVPPNYPPDAKMRRVQGTVVLRAHIDTTGQITNLQIASGPPLLQQPAENAVSQWKYRPYLLAGRPVEVDTTINVIFTLGD